MTYPVPNEQISSHHIFNLNQFEIRVISFINDKNIKLKIKGDINGDLKYKMTLKNGALLYTYPVNLNDGNYKIQIYDENGYFCIEVNFPSDYPNQMPTVKFKTKIFHCNINKDQGNICIKILNNWTSTNPRPLMIEVFDDLLFLLVYPNPDSKLNSDFGGKGPKFENTAREWVKKYANENDFDDLSKQN